MLNERRRHRGQSLDDSALWRAVAFARARPFALSPAGGGKNYPKVALALAVITLAYYFIGLHTAARAWETAHEYVSFIALIGSLFIVAGGIHIQVKSEATPLTNVVFLLIGAIAANFLGTTGASMLLIRPWLRMNRHRIRPYHVVFFIFIVSNVGGCLTPIGDPPLFLGYLVGIPFWWVAEHCYPMWAVGVGFLLIAFFCVDYRNMRRAPVTARPAAAHSHEAWRFQGTGNVVFLAIIITAVFIDHPPFLREGLMAAAALGSYFSTPRSIHTANRFNFHPIQEVAILFIGIFATMMPALDWLQGNAQELKSVTASLLYWGSGSLSSALDNAPTYLCFLKAISSRFVNADLVAQVQHLIQNHGADLANLSGAQSEAVRQTYSALQKYHAAALASGKITTDEIAIASLLGNLKLNAHILAISIGAVFFGANTYIGNGPNLMVKSMAEHEKVPTPDFLTYIWKYALPVMLPMLLLIWWIFFRN